MKPALAATVAALIWVMGLSTSAQASSVGCDFHWASAPRLLIHDEGLGADPAAAAEMRQAVEDVVDEFNRVGGVSTSVTSVATSSDPFVYQTWDGVATPTIHIGFVDDLAATVEDEETFAETAYQPLTGCVIPEAHIVFPSADDPIWAEGKGWNFNTPFDSDAIDNYYDTSPTDYNGDTWFRPVLLHELLHAFGLEHTQSTYAFMNHRGNGGFPWTNRSPEQSVRPLPADIYELRERYPASDTYYDVSVTTTWFNPDFTDGAEAAEQFGVCTPSLGDVWSRTVADGGACGENADGSSLGGCVSEGDKLRVMFAVNNGGTDEAYITYRLYMSADRTLGGDLMSPTAGSLTRPAGASAIVARTFTLPAVADGERYWPIVRVQAAKGSTAGVLASTMRTDWIPLNSLLLGC
jgi:hypothetical protein